MRARSVVAVVAGAALGAAAACASFGTNDTPTVEAGAEAGGDSDASDDSTSPQPGSSCASGDHAVCDDFDESLLGLGFVELVESGTTATVERVDSDASPPKAARFTQAAVPASGSNCVAQEALRTRTMSGELVTNGVAHLALSIRLLSASPMSYAQVVLIYLGDAPPYQVGVRIEGTALHYTEYSFPSMFADTQTGVTLTVGEWTRVTVDVDVAKGTIAVGTAQAAGVPASYRYAGPKGPGVKTVLFVGLPCTQGADAGLAFDVDDVVLDVN